MFAYCGNNPVANIDPDGFGWVRFWENVKEWLQHKKEESQSNEDGTETVGITGSAAFGGAGSASFGITKDKKGNIGVAVTINGGGGMPGIGIGAFKTVTNAPNIYKQEGIGTTIGGSIGPYAVAVGAEYNMLIDSVEDTVYHGMTVSVVTGLYPAPVELHGEVGNTWIWGLNTYDIAICFVNLMLPQ